MGLQVHVEIKDEQVRALIAQLAAFRPNLLPKFEKKASDVLLRRVGISFDKGQSPEGVAWPPISGMGRQGQPLKDSGRLRRSFRAEHGPDWAGAYTEDIRARLFHNGGVVTPKNKKWLCLPYPGAHSAGALRRGVKYSDFNQSVMWTNWNTKHPIVYLVTRDRSRGKRDSIIPAVKMRAIFWLFKSVTIKARPMVGLNEADWPLLQQELDKIMMEAA